MKTHLVVHGEDLTNITQELIVVVTADEVSMAWDNGDGLVYQNRLRREWVRRK